MNMLLEIPTELHFTETQVRCTPKGLLPVVGLAEACGSAFMKLSCTLTFVASPTAVQLVPVRGTQRLTP